MLILAQLKQLSLEYALDMAKLTRMKHEQNEEAQGATLCYDGIME